MSASTTNGASEEGAAKGTIVHGRHRKKRILASVLGVACVSLAVVIPLVVTGDDNNSKSSGALPSEITSTDNSSETATTSLSDLSSLTPATSSLSEPSTSSPSAAPSSIEVDSFFNNNADATNVTRSIAGKPVAGTRQPTSSSSKPKKTSTAASPSVVPSSPPFLDEEEEDIDSDPDDTPAPKYASTESPSVDAPLFDDSDTENTNATTDSPSSAEVLFFLNDDPDDTNAPTSAGVQPIAGTRPPAFSYTIESAMESPTAAPTSFYVEPNPVPSDPGEGYFNYDMNDETYGPNEWYRVNTRNHFTLKEFGPNGWGTWKNALSKDPTENRCHDYRHFKSPQDLIQIDGVPTGPKGIDGHCDAGHEIRTRCGSFPLESDMYKKYILPHKLTVVMNRRECRDLSKDKCDEDRPPVADYPKYSGTGRGWSDLLNFDIKVPGEHRIYNETFDAEIQMLHAHLENEKLSSLGIPIRATADGHNEDFQNILHEFHTVHRDDTQACLKKRRNLRQQDVNKYYEDLMEQGQRDGWYNEYTAKFMLDPKARRELQDSSSANFDPYSKDFMVDMFYFRYRGSMTEPPCMFLTWFFMDTPMLISIDQLHQIKFLLFTHVDPETCEKTSVHNADQSVARPLQAHSDKDETSWIQHCKVGQFVSDLEKHGKPGRRCDNYQSTVGK